MNQLSKQRRKVAALRLQAELDPGNEQFAKLWHQAEHKLRRMERGFVHSGSVQTATFGFEHPKVLVGAHVETPVQGWAWANANGGRKYFGMVPKTS